MSGGKILLGGTSRDPWAPDRAWAGGGDVRDADPPPRLARGPRDGNPQISTPPPIPMGHRGKRARVSFVAPIAAWLARVELLQCLVHE